MKILISITLVLLVATNSFSAGSSDILGVWRTEKDESKVEVFRCGEKLCGKIVWLKDPKYTDSNEGQVGTPIIDRNNPNPAMRSRTLIGLQIMDGFIEQGNNAWGKGTLYDPENGKTYRGKIHFVSPNRLDVRGFIGISVFGRTSEWNR